MKQVLHLFSAYYMSVILSSECLATYLIHQLHDATCVIIP